MQFKPDFPMRPWPIKVPNQAIKAPKQEKEGEPIWLVLAVSILPAVLPSLFERIGHEISTYFKRKRLEKKKKEKEKEGRKRKTHEEEEEGDVVLEMTESEFVAALESGHIRILKDQEEEDEDASEEE